MVSKAATLDVVEQVVDAVDETVDTLERIPNLALNGTTRKQQVVILAATAVAAGGVGAAVSHFVTKKVLRAQFETLLEYQLAEAEKHYTVLQERPSPQDVASKIDEIAAENATRRSEFAQMVSQYNGDTAPTVVEEEDGTLRATQVQNVWEQQGVLGQWDPTVEESKRAANLSDEPYVISKEEYDAGELDHTPAVLTYFSGDETLAEEDGSAIPVHMVDKTVGEDNLLRFGHGSEDDNIVYVRNPRLEIDYEITRSPGKYSREVAGFDEDDEELQNAARMRRR